MKTLKPGSFGHRGLIGKKVVAKEANRVSAKCAIVPIKTKQKQTNKHPEPTYHTSDTTHQTSDTGRRHQGAGAGAGPAMAYGIIYRRVPKYL
jgi:hypothetical protein